jgi:hypothetical protein
LKVAVDRRLAFPSQFSKLRRADSEIVTKPYHPTYSRSFPIILIVLDDIPANLVKDQAETDWRTLASSPHAEAFDNPFELSIRLLVIRVQHVPMLRRGGAATSHHVQIWKELL